VPTTASYEFAYSLSSAGKPVEKEVESTNASQQIQTYNSSSNAPPCGYCNYTGNNRSRTSCCNCGRALNYAPPCVNCSYQCNNRGTTTRSNCGKNSTTKVVATIVPTELSLELFSTKGSEHLAALTLPDLTQATSQKYSTFTTFKAGGAPTKLTAGSSLVRILVKSGNNVVIESIVVTPV
jgi:hypothetical protein